MERGKIHENKANYRYVSAIRNTRGLLAICKRVEKQANIAVTFAAALHSIHLVTWVTITRRIEVG